MTKVNKIHKYYCIKLFPKIYFKDIGGCLFVSAVVINSH